MKTPAEGAGDLYEDEYEDRKSSSHSGGQGETTNQKEESSESFNVGRRESTMIKYSKVLVVVIISL